jgi:hypothetical protein
MTVMVMMIHVHQSNTRLILKLNNTSTLLLSTFISATSHRPGPTIHPTFQPNHSYNNVVVIYSLTASTK